MILYLTKEGRMGFREISPAFAELLRQIPRWADEESDEVDERFYPAPATGAEGEALRADWQAFVQPELHDFFRSTRQIVEADLRRMTEEEDGFAMEIPVKHAEAWLNALNQARLALAARYGFGEKELTEADLSEGPLDERDFVLSQINHYAEIQHWLIEILEALE